MCGENSRGHAARDHLQGEEQRCAGAQRSRARRFARRSQSADAVEAQQAATRNLAGVAKHDLRGEQARQPLAAEQDEGHVSVVRTWHLAKSEERFPHSPLMARCLAAAGLPTIFRATAPPCPARTPYTCLAPCARVSASS